MNKKRVNTLLEQAMICGFPLLMLLLLSPMDIWVGNKTQFAFNWGDFFWIYLAIFCVIELVLTIVLALLPEKVSKVLDSIIFIISVVAYIQTMFLNVKLTSDDGGKMPWDELQGLMIKNSIIWIIIVGLLVTVLFFLKDKATKIMLYVSLFLTLIQTVALITVIATNINATGFVKETYVFGGDNQFKVAKDNNIILFVIDTFGSAQLDLALERDSTCLDGMKDFTYYNNADSVYYKTLPSMTHMLTGVEYDTNMTVGNWSSYAWNNDKTWEYYNTLHQNEYSCYLYSDSMYYTYVTGNNLTGKFDNIVYGKVGQVNRKWLISKLIKMSLYKYSPYIFKPHLEVLSTELDTIVEGDSSYSCETNMLKFKSELEDKSIQIDEDKNAIIIQHLTGTHAPLSFNENAEEVSENETDYPRAARGVLKIINEYLDKLKEIDKYDDSTIIIMADHGKWKFDDTMDPQIVFFVKQAYETHDNVQICSAPVCNCDILPTIYDFVGLDYSNYGTSIYDWNENSKRERIIYKLTDDTLQGWIYSTKDELLKKVDKDPDIYVETDEY